jgi:hypothetical protein
VTLPALRRLSINLALATAGVLGAMVMTALVTGATQEAHEHFKLPADYAAGLLEHPSGTRLIFALDVAFLALYTGFFAALAAYLHGLGRPFTRLALGAMLLVAFLDIIEDHNIISFLALAEANQPIDASSIRLQEVLSSTKFSVSYVSLVLFGLAIPRTDPLSWALSLFLSAGTLATAVLGYAAPPALRDSLDNGRWIGFLAGFVLAIVWLRRAPDDAPSRIEAGN